MILVWRRSQKVIVEKGGRGEGRVEGELKVSEG
jgi:hypothetical protein